MQLCSKPRGHAESIPRPSVEGVSFYHVLRPLDRGVDPFASDGPAAGLHGHPRPSVGTGCPGSGHPSGRARNGAGARTCLEMPRQSIVETSRVAFSLKVFLEAAPDPA